MESYEKLFLFWKILILLIMTFIAYLLWIQVWHHEEENSMWKEIRESTETTKQQHIKMTSEIKEINDTLKQWELTE